jgi:hypothetical protein
VRARHGWRKQKDYIADQRELGIWPIMTNYITVGYSGLYTVARSISRIALEDHR